MSHRVQTPGQAAGGCSSERLLVCAWVLLLAPGLDGAGVAADFSWHPIAGGRMAALAVPSAGRTGFTLLPARQTGIRFTNALDDRLIMENNNFMEGSGVALGDFDGDGWCDLYFCAIDGTNTLYRSLGNWRFEDVTASSGVGVGGRGWHSTGAVFADLDGDGDLDLFVNTLGMGTHCFLNLGQGRFRQATDEAGLRSRTGSLGLALADIDGDGDLDLYVANYGTVAILRAGGRAEMKQVNGRWQLTGPHAERLRVVDGRLEEVGEPDVLYLNDGHGHFKAVPWNSDWFRDERGQPLPAPWDFGMGVQMRDVNGDGAPDIYVCNDFQTVDRLWLNSGTGRFQLLPKLAMRTQSFASMGVDFADVDRDGHLDFFVVEMASREHPRRMRQVGGMASSFPLPGRFENRPEVMRNTFFKNRGDGTYAEVACFSGVEASEWSWQPVFLDVDLDGFEDILVVNGNAFDVQDRDVLRQVRALGRQTPEQTRSNILLYPRLNTANVAFRNRGDLTFEEAGRDWGFDATSISQGIALADLDHDGDLDAVVSCLYGPALVYRNDSTAPRVAVRLRGTTPNIQGIGAMIKLFSGAVPLQTQEMISGGRYLSGDDPQRVFAAGAASTNAMRLEVTWRSGKHSAIDHVQPNHLYELDESAASARPNPISKNQNPTSTLFTDVSSVLGHTHHEPQFNDYAAQPLLMKQLSQLGPGVAWFDLDEDGHDDLFVGSGQGGQLGAFRGDGRGGLARFPATVAAALPDDLVGLAAWVTHDGRRQLLAGLATHESGSNAHGQIRIWELDKAAGRISRASGLDLPRASGSPGPLAVADYDGDGDLDLFVGGRLRPGHYPAPTRSHLFRRDGRRLEIDPSNQAVLDQVGLVSGAVWTDLDGDGWPELVLACEWGPLRIFRNVRGTLSRWNPRVTSAPGSVDSRFSTLEHLTGWWNSVSAGDLDGDGRLDLIAGNWGLNSPYQATAAQPVRLYYGDIGGRGAVDLVEAYFAADLNAVVPRRSLSALAQAAPRLAEFYPTHRLFSTVTVAEMFQRLQIRPAEVQAATLASAAFFNRGDHFEAKPLPAEAQWAPVFAITVADFDGDGWQDVFLSQNFFALRPELPRLDAGRGLLLRGASGGQLEPVPGQASGVTVYGEQRGAAAGDFNEDGRVDLVITQNGAATKLLQNTGAAPGLRVRMLGPPGNPHSIGGMLRIHFKNSTGAVHELHAGSGYWSQDGLIPVLALPETPRRLSVRWPGGKEVQADLPAKSLEISVDAQGVVRALR